ncbi:NADH-quinone oxidoreductase subunit M [Thermotomaculum hydrothermale]|uniref:NADH-quinone oxidoreductase subunit M n=1 Tax=Thermotomaculum hydrothermale TaxID=981385 RepID=A0A7R6PNK7_9BACT|nr:proton-conducting transporter membrane subunit [Thermotomaculum hydrothermale]BBB33382.1 NADH-quinone oxidoreductase subunit M [Thermotomaculum hydrothermale]
MIGPNNVVLIPILAGILAYFLGKIVKPAREGLTLASALTVCYFVFKTPFDKVIFFNYNFNLPAYFEGLKFGTNALSAFFAILIVFSYLFIAFTAFALVKDKDYHGTFYLFFNIVAGSLLGIVYARDLISFFIFWEMMTWSSYFLVIMNGKNPRKTGLTYIVFNVAGAYFMLVAMLMVYASAGSFHFDKIGTALALMPDSKVILISIFFAIGFLVKMATMPLHVWAPDAYTESENSFTGFFSGTLSKMGVYGFLLFFGALIGFANLKGISSIKGTSTLGYAIAWLGVITSVFATFRAIVQDEVKKLLAYSSVAQVGYIVTAMSIGTALGVAGGLYHAVMHTIMKLLLFITVAGVIYRTGKDKFSELGALITRMPLSFLAVLFGIIGLAGMPPFGGFASKWVIYMSLLKSQHYFLLIAMIVSSTTAFLYCYKLIYGIFLGHPSSPELLEAKEVPVFLWFAQVPLMLALAIFGVFPGLIVPYINKAVASLGFKAAFTSTTPYTLSAALGGFNGFVVINVLGVIFVIVLIWYTLFFPKSKKLHRLDIYWAAETPTEETPLHYGYGIGVELHRIPWVGASLSRHITNFYNKVAEQVNGIASVVKDIVFNGDGQIYMLYSVLTLVVIIMFLGR